MSEIQLYKEPDYLTLPSDVLASKLELHLLNMENRNLSAERRVELERKANDILFILSERGYDG